MKHVFSISCAAFLSLVLLVASCKKGDTGPEGPAGPPGPNGPQGPKGDTGVANVIYSAWLDVNYLPDTVMDGNVVVDTVGWYYNMPAPKLTNTILSTGDIKVYINLRTAANPLVLPLPYPWDGQFYIDVAYVTGIIGLSSNAPLGTQGTGANKVQQYRYVLIPGGVPARLGIDWNNWEDVKQKLNIQD